MQNTGIAAFYINGELETLLQELKPEQRRWMISHILSTPQKMSFKTVSLVTKELLVVAKIIENLKKGDWQKAIKKRQTLKNSKNSIDLTKIEDYFIAVQISLMGFLQSAEIDIAYKIKNILGKDLNLDDTIRPGFFTCLQKGRFKEASKIKIKLGDGIDFSEEIKRGFLAHLEVGNLDNAYEIKVKFGDGIDFTEEIRKGFLVNLEVCDTNNAFKIKDKFGDGVDFTKEIKRGFSACLENEHINDAYKIRNIFGESIDLREEIYIGFLIHLEKKHMKTIRKMNDAFKDINFDIPELQDDKIHTKIDIKQKDKNKSDSNLTFALT